MPAARASEDSQGAELIAIAHVRKPVGLRGWCGVTALGDSLGKLKLPAEVLIGRGEKAAKPIRLIAAQPDPRGFRCRFEGSEDREQAERLRDHLIFLAEQLLPRLEEDAFYHFELEGMSVRSERTGQMIGTVRAVYNFPSTDAVEITITDGRQVLVPLRGEVIVSIDRPARCLSVDMDMLDELL